MNPRINRSIFKAYDIRGKYPAEINESVFADIVSGIKGGFRGKVVVGHDARLSSKSLYKSVIGELENADRADRVKTIKGGLMTTPMLYFLVNALRADAGLMITASHNPKEYNGLKIVGRQARPVSGKEVAACLPTSTGVRLLQRQATPISRHLDSPNGETKLQMPPKLLHDKQAAPVKFFINLYADFLKKFLKLQRKLKVVFDCSNGTTGIILKKLFLKSKVKSPKLKVTFINDNPDGNFPAHGPNPLASSATDELKKAVLAGKADLGIIFDADGDRVFFIDNRGRRVDPNEIAYILMRQYPGPYVIGAVSSWRLKKSKAKSPKSKVYVSRVGHYFFKNMMREKTASLGLEHSGHYYFRDFFYCDSGILAALSIITFLSSLDTDLASYLNQLPAYYRSGEINFKVSDKGKALRQIEKFYKKSSRKISKLDGLTAEFADYWFNVRPSNTEDLLRLNMEAKSQKILNEKMKEIKKVISYHL
ncbi:MAG: hypothetical protein A3H63_01070 [Candidatus Harrisonbacteria bacterium RIFCSPLOWO2_02_FULL_45_10c]|uniref:Phosphomannomutase/phosphoglucomutase n=1 Tax=Candidatus Harrisonbacteria bacterium RIFCSPLOWO2_02_FULL_45_10c TaxID=1798410 RepID=A0A1G1ZUP4_9BACT|nr:MAG: hypothetical protein A3H63_01070 [Candidatus Harrisonbacteria bacterium RIFCSPLOWO2_02_FULL_45_10c]